MTVTASTSLNPIFALVLNIYNGFVDVLTSVGTDQTALTNGVIVVITVMIIFRFAGSFGKAITKAFDKLINYIFQR